MKQLSIMTIVAFLAGCSGMGMHQGSRMSSGTSMMSGDGRMHSSMMGGAGSSDRQWTGNNRHDSASDPYFGG
ncbi:hypothetical protein ACFQUU_11385 [Herbaspirillum sp. GCM10030257]|uniref:hypothetical protein n=1 Tax=Herbaspirillum sp. GCM10030257 TaxID=3273393 RepID=UPI003621456F